MAEIHTCYLPCPRVGRGERWAGDPCAVQRATPLARTEGTERLVLLNLPPLTLADGGALAPSCSVMAVLSMSAKYSNHYSPAWE